VEGPPRPLHYSTACKGCIIALSLSLSHTHTHTHTHPHTHIISLSPSHTDPVILVYVKQQHECKLHACDNKVCNMHLNHARMLHCNRTSVLFHCTDCRNPYDRPVTFKSDNILVFKMPDRRAEIGFHGPYNPVVRYS
jgi:hypothetical protein